LGRLISLTLRIPSDYSPNQVAQKVISQLRGIGGSSSTGFGTNRVRSLADAVAKTIEKHQASKIETPIDNTEESNTEKSQRLKLRCHYLKLLPKRNGRYVSRMWFC